MDAALTHTRLLVDAYEACFEFYNETLGLEVTFGDADSGYADFATGNVTLALFDREEMLGAVGVDPDPAGDRAALVFAVDDVDATADRLRTAGVSLVAEPADRPEWGIRTVHARDPDGTLIEWNAPLE